MYDYNRPVQCFLLYYDADTTFPINNDVFPTTTTLFQGSITYRYIKIMIFKWCVNLAVLQNSMNQVRLVHDAACVSCDAVNNEQIA